jgi:hypothetical protein
MSRTRLAAALAALLCSSTASAEEAPATGTRDMGGHTYMHALGISSAFATTNFGTYMTAGYGTTKGRVTLLVPGNPDPQTFEGEVSYAAVGSVLDFEWAFLPGFSARFLLTESLYSGVTGAAVAAVGTNIRLGAGLGLTASFPVGESVRLAARLDASYTPQLGLLLGPALKDAYDSCSAGVSNCTFDFQKLFEQNNVFAVKPGAAVAWTPWAPLGVTANLEWVQRSLEQTGGSTESSGALAAGLALDFDFLNVSTVPVGLVASWSSEWPATGVSSGGFTDVGGGVLYTGRKDLSLGVQAVVRRFRVVPEVDVSWNTFLLLIGLRYYW